MDGRLLFFEKNEVTLLCQYTITSILDGNIQCICLRLILSLFTFHTNSLITCASAGMFAIQFICRYRSFIPENPLGMRNGPEAMHQHVDHRTHYWCSSKTITVNFSDKYLPQIVALSVLYASHFMCIKKNSNLRVSLDVGLKLNTNLTMITPKWLTSFAESYRGSRAQHRNTDGQNVRDKCLMD